MTAFRSPCRFLLQATLLVWIVVTAGCVHSPVIHHRPSSLISPRRLAKLTQPPAQPYYCASDYDYGYHGTVWRAWPESGPIHQGAHPASFTTISDQVADWEDEFTEPIPLTSPDYDEWLDDDYPFVPDFESAPEPGS